MWEILQEKVYKHTSLIWISTTPLTNGCRNNDMIPASWPTPFSVAVSVRPDQRWVFWKPSESCYIPHTL